jgi:predicted transcriptional regulator
MSGDQVSQEERSRLLGMTAQIASAYFSKNRTPAGDISDIIKKIQNALLGIRAGGHGAPPTPAVPIKKSITADHLICLEDGKKLKMLKRYIMKRFSLTPEGYRAKWGLPADYPMVSPNYAKKRSQMAIKLGLGRQRRG